MGQIKEKEIFVKRFNKANKEKLTNEAIANIIGISEGTVRNWKNKEKLNTPNTIELIKLSKLLNTTPDFLCGIKNIDEEDEELTLNELLPIDIYSETIYSMKNVEDYRKILNNDFNKNYNFNPFEFIINELIINICNLDYDNLNALITYLTNLKNDEKDENYNEWRSIEIFKNILKNIKEGKNLVTFKESIKDCIIERKKRVSVSN